MKKWRIPFVLLTVCLGAYLIARHQRQAARSDVGFRPGQLAPPFSLKDLNGRPLALANYHGKIVLLNFWATWCEPCRHEIPEFIQLQKDSSDLQMVGISLDDNADPVRAFYNDFKMNYPIAVGDAALARQYGGILGLPITFIIGCDGRVAAKHIGEVNISDIKDEINSLRNGATCSSKR